MAKQKKKNMNEVVYVVYHKEVNKKTKEEIEDCKIFKVHEFKTKEEALANIESYNKRKKRGKEAFLVIMPKHIGVGTKIYLKDATKVKPLKENDLYGIIVDESKYFWYIRRSWKDENDKVMFEKDSFEEKYINGIFTMIEENAKGEC